MPLILPSNSISALGYDVANSLRFDDGSSDNLTRTPSSSGNRKTFTISFWVKRSTLGTSQFVFNARSTNASAIFFTTGDQLYFTVESGVIQLQTNRVFRDTSAWYHIVYKIDTTQATSTDRAKLYVNGVQETSFATATYPSQNADTRFNENVEHTIAQRIETDGDYFDGYLSEFVMIDGTALDPTSFGETDEDTGIWKPIDVSGLTFGTNGFYLDFENSGSLGADVSGNGNNFTVNNLTSIDQTTDTPTNNFATLNPLAYRLDAGVSLPTYSDGNTTVSYASDGGAGKSSMGTICFDTGKWYWEYKVNSANDTVFGGITRADYDPNDNFAGRSIYYNKTGALSVGTGTGGTANGSYGSTYTTGDIISVAFDCVNGVIWFAKNGTWQNSATTGITLNQFWSPFLEGADSGMSINFGNPPFTISSGNSDGNGYGQFEYQPPSGYLALNTKNLATDG